MNGEPLRKQTSTYGMGRWSASLLLMSGLVSCSATGRLPESQPKDPMPDPRKYAEEMQKLDQSPPGKRMVELERRRSTLDNDRFELRNEYQKLYQTAEFREYQKQRNALYEKQYSAWDAERKVMAEAARQIYTARHEELRKLAASDVPYARKLGLDVLSYPKADGSTSTHPLSVVIACRVLGAPYEWIYPEPSGSPWRNHAELPLELYLYGIDDGVSLTNDEFTLSASRVVAKPPGPGMERLAKMINSLLATNSSTHDAYINLIEGTCDLNLTARGPSLDEIKLAEAKGVKVELRPIARDALVFIVNQSNVVKSISSAEIRLIYEGKIKKWSELGGGTNEIQALWRERNSGSRELFDSFVGKDRPLPEPTNHWVRNLYSGGMAGPFNRVTMEPGSLGYSVYYYEHFMALSPRTRTVAIDGVEPTPETIASGRYPYVAEVFVAYRANEPVGSPARKLVEWLVSAEGQSVVREAGYVPIK